MTDTSNHYQDAPALKSLTLGKDTVYGSSFDAKLLQGVPRSLNRDSLELSGQLPFYGQDIWTGYELYWLNLKGKPVVAMAQFILPFDSECLVESKSFKLYLNSFNQHKFKDANEVEQQLIVDLSSCAKGKVEVKVILAEQFSAQQIVAAQGECIDNLDISVDNYQFDPQLLAGSVDGSGAIISEKLHSNLLKSNCLITNQPDWGTVEINYSGPKIDREALLRYIISFRQHNEFHEQCVERIFVDLMKHCKCQQLSVYARYTRRGGLDINPFRSNFEQAPQNIRQARQ